MTPDAATLDRTTPWLLRDRDHGPAIQRVDDPTIAARRQLELLAAALGADVFDVQSLDPSTT